MVGHGGVRERVERLLGTDASVLDRAGLDALTRDVTASKSFLDAVKVAIARRADALKTSPASAGASDVLEDHGRRTRADAHRDAERARACDEVPGFDHALADGTVTAGHVDAIAHATKDLDDHAKQRLADHAASLLTWAAGSTVDEFTKHCRDLARRVSAERDAVARLERQRRQSRVTRWVDRDTGMHKTLIALDPERDASLWAAIRSRMLTFKTDGGLSSDEATVDAVLDLVKINAAEIDPRVPDVHVHIDWHTIITNTLRNDSLCELTDGTPIPIETVRRLCCEAVIVPILIGPDQMPIDCGREHRTANRKQRRALRDMYRTCAIDGCHVDFDLCHIHHVISWLDHGDTDLANLVPVCNRHHHLVHEGGWCLTMTADRVITLRAPDGAVHFSALTTNRTATQRQHAARINAPPGQRQPAA